jgi:hypothetical protein
MIYTLIAAWLWRANGPALTQPVDTALELSRSDWCPSRW